MRKKKEILGTLTCYPMTTHIGAIIEGVDLTQKLNSKQYQDISAALVEYQVIFFRNQPMSSQNHKDLALYFGEPHLHPAYPHVEGYPEITILESTPENPSKIELWHTDMTFSATPPMGSFLVAHKIPEVGGDTMWGSSWAAFDALDNKMKEQLLKLRATHSFEYGFKESIAEKGRDFFAAAIAKNPPTSHPVIRTHPVNQRKGLFVNPLFTYQIDGMSKEGSDELLGTLYQHMIKDEFLVRFRWQEASLSVWDNRSTIHKPVNDFYGQYRQLRRITINGTKPL